MSDMSKAMPTAESVEKMLSAELAQADVILATAQPILRHLLANDEHTLFSDQVIARIRGMMLHLARQLLLGLARDAGIEDCDTYVQEREERLAVELLEDTAFLGHAHALTIEAQLADRLQQRSGIDPVLSPLLQELTASEDQDLAAAAMRCVAAQARFMQNQRRMELPLQELPAELFHTATRLLRTHAGDHAQVAKQLCDRLRDEYDESDRRIGQATRLLMAMGPKARRALAVDHAGLSLFATALSMASEQERDVVILSLGENQCARLALSLRAAGLGQSAVEEQFLYLHPEITLPDGFDAVRAERAAALLAAAASEAAN
ncbi:hypothetical protein [Aurantiacibacter gilvus]|uniref:DUF2336 domain-containing protein n=1 Tax=Aurantiacibacter gilvus TaxID=3139141 RepID=A0ABU9ICN5_9SPHN